MLSKWSFSFIPVISPSISNFDHQLLLQLETWSSSLLSIYYSSSISHVINLILGSIKDPRKDNKINSCAFITSCSGCHCLLWLQLLKCSSKVSNEIINSLKTGTSPYTYIIHSVQNIAACRPNYSRRE